MKYFIPIWIFTSLLLYSCLLLSQDKKAYSAFGNYADLEKIISQNDDTLRVVNFWATWCAPCVKELPLFLAAENQYKNKPVKFIYVSLDFKKNVDAILSGFRQKKMNEDAYIFWLYDMNMNTWIRQVDDGWEGAIPATLFVKGAIKKIFKNGAMSEELLKKYITQFL